MAAFEDGRRCRAAAVHAATAASARPPAVHLTRHCLVIPEVLQWSGGDERREPDLAIAPQWPQPTCDQLAKLPDTRRRFTRVRAWPVLDASLQGHLHALCSSTKSDAGRPQVAPQPGRSPAGQPGRPGSTWGTGQGCPLHPPATAATDHTRHQLCSCTGTRGRDHRAARATGIPPSHSRRPRSATPPRLALSCCTLLRLWWGRAPRAHTTGRQPPTATFCAPFPSASGT